MKGFKNMDLDFNNKLMLSGRTIKKTRYKIIELDLNAYLEYDIMKSK